MDCEKKTMKENECLVSICCITYNQVQYIDDAINGFLSQVTPFEFEILIHDDASTDGTLEKLIRWEKADERVKVFKEKENKYHTGVNYINQLLLPHAKGKYVAICEGDDYWIDKRKLASQVEYIESHPSCSLCVHAAEMVDFENMRIGTMGLGNSEMDLDSSKLANNWHIPTASFLFRKSDALSYAKEWRFKTPVGDFPRAFYLSTIGDIHYDPSVMSVYRYRVPGSWTSSTQLDRDSLVRSTYEWIDMLNSIDSATDGQFHEALVTNAKNKVMRLYGRSGGKMNRNVLIDDVLQMLSAKDKLCMMALRILGWLGFDLQRISWGGARQWTIVRLH